METSLVFIVAFLWSSATLVTCSSAGGLHMELTHVDAKGSYTTAERVQRAMAISRQRLASITDVSAPVHWNTSQYIAEYLIGSPPQRAEAIIDTGSDLIWTQCSIGAEQDLPVYNASKSDSFHLVPCNDTLCLATQQHTCATDGSCAFGAFYGAGQARGSIATEVFTFENGSATLTFGCVKQLLVTPGTLDGSSGLIGLGRGPLSLVSQTGATKFSYCHTPYLRSSNATPGASSHLFVGASASLSGGGGTVMSMSFVDGPKNLPFYYVPLVGITVGHTRLPIPPAVFALNQTRGGVFIDSGTPITGLVDGAYLPLREELAKQLNGSLVPPPTGSGMDLCVAVAQEKTMPSMVFHFSGGADMVLPPENYWVPLDNSTSCMVMNRYGGTSVIGNFQLQNIHLLYDLAKDELSFQTADCSSL